MGEFPDIAGKLCMNIARNIARCLKCDTEVESVFCHDFQQCTCGNIFVDGGREYIRHGAIDQRAYQDMCEFEERADE